MAEYRDIATALATRIDAVAGVENVFKLKPYAARLDEKENIFLDTSQRLQQWRIMRALKRAESIATHLVHYSSSYLIFGLMSVNVATESEIVFQELIDGIITALNSNLKILPTAEIIPAVEIIQFQADDTSTGTIMHSCIIQVNIRTIEEVICPP